MKPKQHFSPQSFQAIARNQPVDWQLIPINSNCDMKHAHTRDLWKLDPNGHNPMSLIDQSLTKIVPEIVPAKDFSGFRNL